MPADLDQLQRLFLRALNTADTSLISQIAPSDSLSPTDQIAIYRNNTQATRHKTLQAIYPMVDNLLGEACFKTLTHYFSLDVPATHWNLNHYGADFPAYLLNPPNQFSAFRDLPYLHDLAQLEWFLHLAYYAADRSAFPSDAFYALPAADQPNARLLLAADIHLLETPWPVLAGWQHWQQSGALPVTLAGCEVPQLLCVHRDALQPTVSSLSPAAFALLSHLPDCSLAELADQPTLAEAMPLITEFIQQGWIADFSMTTPATCP